MRCIKSCWTKNVNGKSAALEALGGTQLLNSFSKNNKFDHPLYNIAYPMVSPQLETDADAGSDYFDADKNHISKAQLKRILADSLNATLERTGLSLDNEENQRTRFKNLQESSLMAKLAKSTKKLAS